MQWCVLVEEAEISHHSPSLFACTQQESERQADSLELGLK